MTWFRRKRPRLPDDVVTVTFLDVEGYGSGAGNPARVSLLVGAFGAAERIVIAEGQTVALMPKRTTRVNDDAIRLGISLGG